MTIITPEMANADEAMTARDLGQITIDLNQCIGAGCHSTQDYSGHGPYLVPHTGKPPRGKVEYDKYKYLEKLKDGKIEIASLKNPEGVSEATVRIDVRGALLGSVDIHERFIKDWVNREYSIVNKDNKELLQNADFGASDDRKKLFEAFPGLEKAFTNHFKPDPEKYIVEMKGKDNGPVKKEYVPHMVSWLNQHANELTDVRDLNNLPSVHDLNSSYNAIGKMMDENTHWYSPTVELFFDKLQNENALPRFFTTDEFALKATERGVDLSAEPKNDVVNDGKLTDEEIAKRQKYYETVSQELRDTFTDEYLQDAFNGDQSALQAIFREINERPTTYFLGSPSPGVRQHVINRLRNQGLYNPNATQQFETEPPNRPEFPESLGQNMRDYFEGNEYNAPEDMIEPYATETRILMGSQRPEARLPRFAHQSIVEMLLDQDNTTVPIRSLLDHLQTRGGEGLELTEPEAENLLNIIVNWTERYPLNE
jgi:hypothetical protein